MTPVTALHWLAAAKNSSAAEAGTHCQHLDSAGLAMKALPGLATVMQ